MGSAAENRRPRVVSLALGRLWAVKKGLRGFVDPVHRPARTSFAARREVRVDLERETGAAVSEVLAQNPFTVNFAGVDGLHRESAFELAPPYASSCALPEGWGTRGQERDQCRQLYFR